MKVLRQSLFIFSILALAGLQSVYADSDGYKLSLSPDDARVNVGDVVQYQAQLTDDSGNDVAATFAWQVKKDEQVGFISADGLFTAEQDGEAEIEVTAVDFDLSQDTHVYVGSADGDGDDHNGDDHNGDDHNGDDHNGDDHNGDDHNGDDHGGNDDGSAYEFVIKINPHKIETPLNSQVQFTASVFDLQGSAVDTSVIWELSGWPIGDIDENGLFTAQAYGEAHVLAHIGQDVGKAKIEVEEDDSNGHDDHGHGDKNDHGKNGFSLTLSPIDTAVYVGDTVQFSAVLTDSNGQLVQTTLNWKIEDHSNVGTITQDGLFSADSTGLAFIEVKGMETEAKTSIQVMSRDGGEVNGMRVYRVLPNGAVIDDSVIVHEGEMLKLTDLPFPFGILNGSMLTVPEGALHEDINLTIDLSGLADVQGDSVLHPQNIVNAVGFKVSVAGDTIHPYYFDKPLRISIPYDRDLLQKYGINPDSLDIAYYLGDDFLERVGVENVVVDTTQNRIFAEIIHFSTLVIFSRQQALTSASGTITRTPTDFVVHQNYPNPFNPSTTISFELSRTSDVQVTIYNIAGERVATLYQGIHPAGIVHLTWNATDSNGKSAPSGLYYYQVKSTSQTATRRMLLLR